MCASWRVAAVLGLGLLAACDQGCEDDPKAVVASPPVSPDEPEWRMLLPDSGMGNWERVEFGGGGEVTLADGILTMEQGVELTGVVWRGEMPTVPYEIEWEFRRVLGTDFPCGFVLPVAGEGRSVTLVLGGWGGGVVGISSIDGMDASENSTTRYRHFEDGQWYGVRMTVEEERLTVWIDGEEKINVEVAGRELGLRAGDISRCAPFGVAAWQTAGEIKGLRWRRLPE